MRERNKIETNKSYGFKLTFAVQLPSLIRDPTIAKDPKRTPTAVSLSHLQELQKNHLLNHVH
jgi:hypothetical protein